MDNKKFYKKLSTFFWFVLASLPLLVGLIGFIGQFWGGISQSTQDVPKDYYNSFQVWFTQNTSWFNDNCPNWCKSVFYDVFDIMDIDIMYDFVIIPSWFLWAYIIELILDILLWLPRFAHKYIEKVGE